MVIEFLKDDRLDQERQRADVAEAKATEALAQAAAAEIALQQERKRADREREIAERLSAELGHLRRAYMNATEAIVQYLQERQRNHYLESNSPK